MPTANTPKESMNPKDLERAAVGLVRGGFSFIVDSGRIIAHDPIQSSVSEEETFNPVELRTLHAVHKFLEIRS